MAEQLSMSMFANRKDYEAAQASRVEPAAWMNGASLTIFAGDRERYPLGGGGDMATARYMRSDHHDTPLYLASPPVAVQEEGDAKDLTDEQINAIADETDMGTIWYENDPQRHWLRFARAILGAAMKGDQP